MVSCTYAVVTKRCRKDCPRTGKANRCISEKKPKKKSTDTLANFKKTYAKGKISSFIYEKMFRGGRGNGRGKGGRGLGKFRARGKRI